MTVWDDPRLLEVTADDVRLCLTVRARVGQSSEDLEAAGAVIRDAAAARSLRTTLAGPGLVRFELLMRDELTTTLPAVMPGAGDVTTDRVTLGRTETGQHWRLGLAGRHTLIVGASGSGKGSLVWGIVGGLAPALHAGLVRVYGIDLKYGVEVSIGGGLFAAVATTEEQAVAMLDHLDQLIRVRGEAMAGHVRNHTATTADPLVVLVVDELASLTGYMTDRAKQKDADRLLRSILSKGRAMGVVVVGALQDPRKETLPSRGLFTQTVALRLRSKDEVTMVLGEGTADAAPAHRIDPATPGMGYVQGEDGSTIRVRAAYWTDELIRQVAARYPGQQVTITARVLDNDSAQTASRPGTNSHQSGPGSGSRRAPRKPRAPRARATVPSSADDQGRE